MMSLGQTMLDFPAAIFELDSQGCILAVSPYWETLMGLQAATVMGKSWFKLVSPDERDALEKRWLDFQTSFEPLFEDFFTPYCIYTQIDWLKIRVQKASQGYLACLENHTLFKQVQQSNFHLKEKLAALFRNSNQMIVMLDRQHRITEFNHVAAIVAQQRFFREIEVGEDFINYVQPDRLDDFYSSFEQALQGQHVFKERVIYASDGQGIRYEIAYSPIHNPDGEISGVCFTSLNIETQKQMQELLHHEQIFVSAILDTSSALILVLDSAGKIIRFNRACEAVSGYTFSEIQGQSFEFLAQVEDRACLLEKFKHLTSTAFPLRLKLPLQTRHGEKRSISWTATTLMNIDGQVEYLVATGIDISESEKTAQTLREQEEILRQVQKLDAIGQLAGEVAHDFNNILAGIQGYIHLLEDTPLPQETARIYVKEIKHIVEKARHLTGKLLIFSGKHRHTPRPVHIFKILEQMQPLFLPLLSEQMQLDIQQEKDLPPILIEPTHLDQLLMNLIVNARDAMGRQGKIQIHTFLRQQKEPLFVPHFGEKPAGDYVCIQICDQGPGIPIEIREKIYTPFFTTKAKGTGLGLSIVYGVVNEYGGFILLDTGPHGTTFTICFPALSSAIAPTHAIRPAIAVFQLTSEEESELIALWGKETELVFFPNFQAWAQAEQAPQLLLTALKLEILAEVHGHFSTQTVPANLAVLYLSGYEETEMQLLDQLEVYEDVLVRPINALRLQRWLQKHRKTEDQVCT